MKLKAASILWLITLLSCQEVEPTAPSDPMKEGLDALYTRRDAPAAEVQFRKVLATHPDHYGATYQLAVALDEQRKTDEATGLWEKVKTLAEASGDEATASKARARLVPPASLDKHAIWMQSGLNLLYEMKRPEDAAAEFAKILAENPEHYGANYQIATALDRSGKPGEARAHWEKVLVMARKYKDEETETTARARLDDK